MLALVDAMTMVAIVFKHLLWHRSISNGMAQKLFSSGVGHVPAFWRDTLSELGSLLAFGAGHLKSSSDTNPHFTLHQHSKKKKTVGDVCNSTEGPSAAVGSQRQRCPRPSAEEQDGRKGTDAREPK